MKHLEYWETLCPNADTEIDNYVRLLLKGEKTIKQVFQRIKEIELDTENFDADICKETINKVFYYVKENTDISVLDIAEAYHQVEEENEEDLEEETELETFIITNDKDSYQLSSLSDINLKTLGMFKNQTIIHIFDAENFDAAKEVYEIVFEKDCKSNRNPLISHNGFLRSVKRFEKIALQTIDSWSDDKAFKERFDSEVIHIVKKSIAKLIETHKSKPFKRKSAFTEKITVFRNCDDVIKDVRVSYTLSDDKLTFKLLTKTKSRFKRKCQFILNIKETK